MASAPPASLPRATPNTRSQSARDMTVSTMVQNTGPGGAALN
jgi:hypothetical protein